MTACCSTYGGVADRQFDVTKVSEELKQYRKRGPGPTTRLLRDGLVTSGLVDALAGERRPYE